MARRRDPKSRPWQEKRTDRMVELLEDHLQEFRDEMAKTREVTLVPGQWAQLRAAPNEPEPHLRVELSPDGTLKVTSTFPDFDPDEYDLPNRKNAGIKPGKKGEIPRDNADFNAAKTVILRYWRVGRGNTRRAEPDSVEIQDAAWYIVRDFEQSQNPFSETGTQRRFAKAAASLVDQETWDTAKMAHQNVNAEAYNRFVNSKDAVNSLRRTNPGALTLALARDKGKEPVNHPGQMVTQARELLEKLDVDKRLWKKLATMPVESMKIISRRSNTTETMKATLRAAGEANLNGPPHPKNIARAIRLHRDASRTTPDRWYDYRGVPRPTPEQNRRQDENLITAMRLLMAAGEDTLNQNDHQMGLGNVKDYLVSQQARDEEIASTTWRGLKRRVDDWHAENFGNRQQVQQYQLQRTLRDEKTDWNSLLESFTCKNELEAVPLITADELREEGRKMSHCVGNYDRACVRGDTRIFGLRKDGERSATASIEFRNGRWVAAQAQGARNRPSAAATEAAREIARRYQKAWSEHTDRPRHRAFRIDPDTGKREEFDQAPRRNTDAFLDQGPLPDYPEPDDEQDALELPVLQPPEPQPRRQNRELLLQALNQARQQIPADPGNRQRNLGEV